MWVKRKSKKGVLLTRGIYKGFRLLGPYMSSDGGRMEYRLLDEKAPGKPWSVSVPRFVMEQHLGRFLNAGDRVWHRDGNRANNSIENLEVISRTEWSLRLGTIKNFKK